MTQPDTRELRKSRGAFFTPSELAHFIATWAIRSAYDTVLEPSCGEAVFLQAAALRITELGGGTPPDSQLTGVDLHAPSVQRAAELLDAVGVGFALEVGNFFSFTMNHKVDAVIGNPPYIRYQDFNAGARNQALEAALTQGVRLSGLTSSWAPFTIHACSFLATGGRLGMVLPAELLSVTYAGPVREYLLDHFNEVRLVVFTERVFPDVQEEVVLLLADGFQPSGGGTDHFEVVQRQGLSDLGSSTVSTSWTPSDPSGKWSLALGSSESFNELASSSAGILAPLESWGHISLGSVSGSNKYFAISPKHAHDLGLADDDVRPLSPPGSTHLRALSLTQKDLKRLGDEGRQTLLFYPGEDPSPAARNYIAAGEAVGVNDAYKCRVRRPWWRVPTAPVADLFVTYMNDETVNLCANSERVLHLNSVHGLVQGGAAKQLQPEVLALAAHNSATALSAELTGRAYGGGLLKLEPREARRLLVPSIDLVTRHRDTLTNFFDDAQDLLRDGRSSEVREHVDDILGLTLTRSAIDEIRQTRDSLYARRRARRGRKD